jgi:hypothetical protein
MVKRILTFALTMLAAAALSGFCVGNRSAEAAGPGQPTDWNRFNYYPYVYYPHNFQAPQEFDHMYYRYPANRRIPVFNSNWHNFYLMDRPYHTGHHFILDTF